MKSQEIFKKLYARNDDKNPSNSDNTKRDYNDDTLDNEEYVGYVYGLMFWKNYVIFFFNFFSSILHFFPRKKGMWYILFLFFELLRNVCHSKNQGF